MLAGYYSALARAKLFMRSGALAPVRSSLRRVPLLRSRLPGAKRWAARMLLPEKPRWVRVETGLARGLWLHLNLNDEGHYWLGDYEAPVQALLTALCTAGTVFYDIGASLGFFSLAVANSIGRTGKVFAFEPEPENCVRLREMAVRNGLQDRLALVEAAVWSCTSSAGAPFKRGGRQGTYGGVVADGVTPVLAEGEMRMVSAVSLDDFICQGNPAPDVLKVDVEGGECEVLKGGEQLFSRTRPALICEVHREEAARWVTDWVAAKEYAAVWHVPHGSFPRLLFGQPAGRRADRDLDHFFCHG